MTEQQYLTRAHETCLQHGATRVVLFGSRARGTASPSSDFDLAVFGVPDVRGITEQLRSLPTLFSADVVNMETCTNEALLQEVAEHGICL